VTEQSLPRHLDEMDHSLNGIRDALETLNRFSANDAVARQAVQAIGGEINSLARLADELRDEQRRSAV
jgi:hypothetical protein